VKFTIQLFYHPQTPLGDERQSPWRFDPCQMEANNVNEEQMKILQGRVKVLWVHGSNEPNYKLIITVVSKGDSCRHKSKHPCLKFGLVSTHHYQLLLS
jgi:hypothetical protein